MKRREFITLLSGAAAAWPLAARAQQPVKTYRMGFLSGGSEAPNGPNLAAFRRGMRDLGYVEGETLAIEARFAEGKFERLPSLANELLALDPDVLFVQTTPANLVAKSATSTVPIVMIGVADPIGVELIANLARPGS